MVDSVDAASNFAVGVPLDHFAAVERRHCNCSEHPGIGDGIVAANSVADFGNLLKEEEVH